MTSITPNYGGQELTASKSNHFIIVEIRKIAISVKIVLFPY